MKEEMSSPPRWAQRLLAWYCRPALLEDLQGDLHEYFERNCREKGLRRARVIYVLDVLKFFRLYTIRKPEFINLLIHWLMLGSYIKTSGRSMMRNKLFSTINIAGLAISMSVGLVLIGLLSDMNAYDSFHENRDRIYRVISRVQNPDREAKYASTSLRAGKDVEETAAGVEQVAILTRVGNKDLVFGDKTISPKGFYASGNIFSVFTFPMLSGDPATALKAPFSIVLTESTAKKLMGSTDALGKTVTLRRRKKAQDYVVTGVLKDIPLFSHFTFDMLTSLSSEEVTEKKSHEEMAWSDMWGTYVYLLLPEKSDLQSLQATLNTISEAGNKTITTTPPIQLELQPLTDIALGELLNNSLGKVMGKQNLWILAILSFIVVLSACFNYTNLSIARSLRRSREVGIRKVIGALRTQVLGQFIVEAVMISLLAMVIAFVLFIVLKPYFLSLNSQYQNMLTLELSPKLILYYILFAVAVGIIAGFFPALFFSRISAIQVLRNITAIRVFRKLTVRKTLIVAQFTVSLMFIAATITGYKHYKQVIAFDLGFKTENILNIRLSGPTSAALAKELSEIPEVEKVSAAALVSSIGNSMVMKVKYDAKQDSVEAGFNIIDEHYLPLHGHKLAAGRNFVARSEKAEESEVIVNDKLVKRLDIGGGDLQQALGETITVDGKKLQIIGVIKDYFYGRPTDERMGEAIFRYSAVDFGYLNVKVISADWPATLAKIEKAWMKIDNVHPLDAVFYDDQIENAYQDFSSRIKIMGALAFLAICIATIGLLGMVVFTTETRLKEISIRKVLGAGEGSLVFLMSKGFLVLLAVAALIALPATFFFFNKIALAQYAASAPPALSELMIGIAAVMVVAFLMIGAQTLKVARSNPANVLKNE